MTSSNPLPDEVREAAIETVIKLHWSSSPSEIVDAVAPILLAYQAKVDAEIVEGEALNDETGDNTDEAYNRAIKDAARAILAQFPAVPTDTEADHG